MELVGPLSFEQRSIYNYLILSKNGEGHQILDLTYDFKGLALFVIYKIVSMLYSRNSSLRTVISLDKDKVFQKIRNVESIEQFVEYVDFTDESNVEVHLQGSIASQMKKITLEPNSLLCRCVLFRLKGNHIRCVFLLHHIMSDQWSLQILKNQLKEIVGSLKKGKENNETLNLDSYSYSMIDYAQAQRLYFQKNKDKIIHYWKKKLGSLDNDTISSLSELYGTSYLKNANEAINISKAIEESEGDVLIYKIDGKVKGTIDSILKNCNVGLMALTFAVFNLLPLYHGLKGKALLIASPVRNILHPKNRVMIGPCVGGVYFHDTKNYDKVTGKSMLMNVYFQLIQAIKHLISDHSLFHLDEKLLREKSDVYVNVVTKEFGVELEESHYNPSFSKKGISYYPLQCMLYEQEDNICLIWEFRTAFFSTSAVKQLTLDLEHILRIINTSLNTPLDFNLQEQSTT